MTKMLFSRDKARKDVLFVVMMFGDSFEEAMEKTTWVDEIPDGTEFLFPDGEDWAMFPYEGAYLKVHRDCCVEVA